jgi:hypothetical protein
MNNLKMLLMSKINKVKKSLDIYIQGGTEMSRENG